MSVRKAPMSKSKKKRGKPSKIDHKARLIHAL